MNTNLGAPKPRNTPDPLPRPKRIQKKRTGTINNNKGVLSDDTLDIDEIMIKPKQPEITIESSDNNKINQLESDLDNVKCVLHDNIRSSIDNLDNTEQLYEKTEQLRSSSKLFNKQSKKSKLKYYWKNKKLQLIIGGIVVIIIIIILH